MSFVFQKLVYWDVDSSNHPIKLVSPSIFAALDGIDKGTIPSKTSQNIAERVGVVRRVIPSTTTRLTLLLCSTSMAN